VKKLLFLELNEVNFEFVEHYARRGALPTFARVFERHGYARTRSETVYEHIEPWIQWFTVHTGKPFAEHQVFRLGDGPQSGASQIWEALAHRGLKVAAFSPMNAGNAVADAAFFVPDPWTRTSVAAPQRMRAAYEAISQAVGDNAEGKLTPRSAMRLALGLALYSKPANWPAYARFALTGLKRRWARAVFLDRFLADCFLHLWQRTRPDFATLFLNGAAHLQHHYLFNCAAYRGPHHNPRWYLPSGMDPVFEMYRLYDRVLAECLELEPGVRVMIATGLHQDPVDEPVFYWRLRDHAAFLRELGCEFERVEPRMSRDFLVQCASAQSAAALEQRLLSGRSPQGEPLFEVDNRGDSLFATLAYPHDIGAGFRTRFGDRTIDDFSREVVFVAIKNGRHNGIGYFVDTGGRAEPHAEPIPLTELWNRMLSAFA
jgi:hypothetical protein